MHPNSDAAFCLILFLFSIAFVIADGCRYFSGPKAKKTDDE